jgi:hypothetical protein
MIKSIDSFLNQILTCSSFSSNIAGLNLPGNKMVLTAQVEGMPERGGKSNRFGK